MSAGPNSGNHRKAIAMNERQQFGDLEADVPDGTDCMPGDPLRGLDLGVELPEREFRLYARYLRALALLCECAPYVDDADYVDLIDELLADAVKHYPLACRHDGDRREIALRSPTSK